jgi:hypothetical protein
MKLYQEKTVTEKRLSAAEHSRQQGVKGCSVNELEQGFRAAVARGAADVNARKMPHGA